MLRIKPFAGVRPEPDAAQRVASVPYDVVNTSEARELAKGNDQSFLHVIRPEIDLPDGTDPHDERVYAAAVRNFGEFQQRGLLVREHEERIYLYRQEAELLGKRVSQMGVVCCCHIDDYASGLIKKHEKTRKDKEDDRTRHMVDLGANPEPVFFLHKDDAAIAGVTARALDAAGEPLFDFTAPDGVRHTVWRCGTDFNGPLVEAFGSLPCAYVADGHHRTASAARAGAERRAANANHTGNEEYNWFLTVLFAASKLTILPYHRVVKDLNGLTAKGLLDAISAVCAVEPTNDPNPPAPGTVCMYLPDGAGSAEGWYALTFDPSSIDRSDPINSLDHVLLSQRVLEPILGIGDIRTDPRIDFVGGIRGTGELERRVNSGSAAVAFSMHAVTIEQLIGVADAKAIMPPKCTWFEPKLRSGLLVHTLD